MTMVNVVISSDLTTIVIMGNAVIRLVLTII